MKARNRKCEIVSSPYVTLGPNEYIVALRTSDIPLGGDYGNSNDYHFMKRLQNGTWQEKHGKYKTNFAGRIDIYTFSWDKGDIKGYYNSDIIFFKVGHDY